MTRAGARGTRLVAAAVAGVSLAGAAAAQTLQTHRGRTLVVGTPGGGARVDRVNPGRTGQASDPLPASGLRIEWQTLFLGVSVEQAPLVDAAGTTYVLGGQGDVIALGLREGAEVWRAQTGAGQPGPAALLSDGSVVFVSGSGEAIAARAGQVRWRARFGRPDALHPAPLPLEDGGVVVATARDLAALDADGNERARTTLPEAAAAPLVSALGRVVIVTASGAVYAWSVGGEPARVGSFGSPIDQGAALLDDHTLVAVTSGHTHLTTVDIARGTTATRSIASTGLWLGPPATSHGTTHLLELTQTSDLLVSLDGAGTVVSRALLSTRQPLLAADGGPIALVAPPHVPPIVDSAGVVAFVTSQEVGTAAGAAVESLTDVCAAASNGAAAGLAPLGVGAFVVACRAGTVVAVSGRPRAIPGRAQ